MSLLILAYHRTSAAGGGHDNVHCLSERQFRTQIEHIRAQGYPVLSWRNFPSQASAPQRLTLAFSFDDGNGSDLGCARLLESLGYDALFFIATAYLGQAGYLDRDGVRELQRLGMSIGSHTHRHIQLPPLEDAVVFDELRRSREILEDLAQQPIEHVSFPGGAYDTRIVGLARQAGYRYCFTSDWGLNGKPQHASGVYCRTSLLNHLDTARFDALLRQRNYPLRQLGFKTKEWVKKSLGMERYIQLRRALLDLQKYRNGRFR